MLQDHERAAMMVNEGNVTWPHFIQSRFIGQPGRGGAAAITLEISAVGQASAAHAQFNGLLEYSSGSALPVVVEVVGTIGLENREVQIEDAAGNDPAHNYEGTLSENGRVLTLRSRSSKGPGKPIYLIHEGTARELFGD